MKHLLAEPRQVRHTASSPAHLRVEWDDVATDETGYRIWRREAGGAWYLAGETGPNATHFDDGGMQELTAYEHKVAAFNATGEGMAATTPGATTTLRMEPHLKPEVIISRRGRTFPAGPARGDVEVGRAAAGVSNGQRRAAAQSHARREPVARDLARRPQRLVGARGCCCAAIRETIYGKRRWSACPTAGWA